MHIKLTPGEIDVAIRAWLRQQGFEPRGVAEFVTDSSWGAKLQHAIIQVERPDTPEPVLGPFRDKPV